MELDGIARKTSRQKDGDTTLHLKPSDSLAQSADKIKSFLVLDKIIDEPVFAINRFSSRLSSYAVMIANARRSLRLTTLFFDI